MSQKRLNEGASGSKENHGQMSLDLESLSSAIGGSQSFDMEVQKQLEEKRMLELRLRELQEKKAQMDQLVHQLQNMRDAGLMPLQTTNTLSSDLVDDTQMETEGSCSFSDMKMFNPRKP